MASENLPVMRGQRLATASSARVGKSKSGPPTGRVQHAADGARHAGSTARNYELEAIAGHQSHIFGGRGCHVGTGRGMEVAQSAVLDGLGDMATRWSVRPHRYR